MPTHWAVAAPFFVEGQPNGWLSDFVPGGRHTFASVSPPTDAPGSRRIGERTTSSEWKRLWGQATRVLDEPADGMITLFPQLPAIVGMRRRIRRRKGPLVAWCFNLGRTYGGAKGHVARFGLRNVDRFVCHSRGECVRYSDWLGIPRERFEFVPLQRGVPAHADVVPDRERPFILAMGSARRDYPTFFKAVEKLGLPTVVVAAPHAVAGLTIPNNVELKQDLSWDDCMLLGRRALVNVVPVMNNETGSGQITMIQAMRMSQPLVATRCIGTEDYVEDGVTGLLVPPADVDAMAAAIRALWDDADLRRRIGDAAGARSRESFSDQAAGVALARVLDEVIASRTER